MIEEVKTAPYSKPYTTVWISVLGIRFGQYYTSELALKERNNPPHDWIELLKDGQRVTSFVLNENNRQVETTYIYDAKIMRVANEARERGYINASYNE